MLTAICDRWPAYTPDSAWRADAGVIGMLVAEGRLPAGLVAVDG